LETVDRECDVDIPVDAGMIKADAGMALKNLVSFGAAGDDPERRVAALMDCDEWLVGSRFGGANRQW